MRMFSKADLHLHSRYSDRSAEWVMRRLDFPDSASEPDALYERLREAGMDFVTLTDHDRIDGCLEIAGRPGVFLSEQISAYFPEDRCRVDLLAWNITEAQHREIQALRENLYDLQRYLAGEGIVHAVAHPLYRLDKRFGASHLERLILLFRHFEGLNGLRHGGLSETARFLLSKLNEEKIAQLADIHGIMPTHEKAWIKIFTGGSDDHGGFYPGAASTRTASCKTVSEFLERVARGECETVGRGGTPLILSHGLYNTLYGFAGEKFFRNDRSKGDNGLIHKMFSRFMEGRDPTEFSLAEKIEMVAQGIVSGKIFELAKPAHASLWKRLSAALSDADFKRMIAREVGGSGGIKDDVEPERRAFRFAALFVNQIGFRFFSRCVQQLSSGNLVQALQDVGILMPLLLGVSPYVYAFRAQALPREWLREACGRIAGEIPAPLRNRKRAWFTDTLEDLNGVATTIRKMTAAGAEAGADLVVVTCRADAKASGIPVKNFTPVGEFELPEYELQKLSFPPILEMIDYIEREKFTELIISTPGPVGLTALLAGKLLGLRTVGIYHTDFPQYVRILTDDSFLETLTWKFMHAFYSQLDLLYVNSGDYRDCWVQRGIAPEKIAILPRGLDVELFHPARRDPAFWSRWGGWNGGNGEPVLLYVGRISREKNLDLIVTACRALPPGAARVAFVGDGPYLEELRALLPQACFTGALSGAELAAAYASADLFLFPSTTDTFGNVVIEAHASGLPTIVSDAGGPKDLVRHEVNGLVTRSLDTGDFTAAIRRLIDDAALRRALGENARRGVEDRDWSRAFGAFWSGSPE